MENTYKVYPILTCQIRLDKGFFTYLKNYGEKILIPSWVWLILGGKEPTLVDAGTTLAEFMKYSIHCSGGEEGIPIEDSLRKFGLSVSDISTIILTHLHSDHCLNAKKFPKAKIIVQEEELNFAMNPHPLFAPTHNKEWYNGLNFETVEGDTEIFPGVEVLLTPGHSVGSQSVSINTQQGKLVVAGFCAIDDNFNDRGDIIPGSHIDTIKAYDSMIKVRKAADIIIPLHSERVLVDKQGPW